MRSNTAFAMVLLSFALLRVELAVCAEETDGWISLFNGEDLSAMEVREDQNSFRVDNGEICAIAGKSAWLSTKERYQDFDFRVEFKCEENENSGIYIHAPLWGRQSSLGMELQILGAPDQEPNRDNCGAIYGVEPPRKNALKAIGEWNAYEISYHESRLTVRLNGELIHDIETEKHAALRDRLQCGYIGLQNHGDDVRFRNVWLRPGPSSEKRARIEHFPRVMKGERPALSLDRLSVLRVVASTPDGLVFSSGRVGETWDEPVLIPGTQNAIQHDLFDFPGGTDPLVAWSDGRDVYVSFRDGNGWKSPQRVSSGSRAFYPTLPWVAQWEHYLAYVEKSGESETIHVHMLNPKHEFVEHQEIATGREFTPIHALVADCRWRVIASWAGLPPDASPDDHLCVGLVEVRLQPNETGSLHWFKDRSAAGSVIPCYGLDGTFSMLRPIRRGRQMAWCHNDSKASMTDQGPDLPIGIWSGDSPPTPVLRPLGHGYIAAWSRRNADGRRIHWTWYDGVRWNPKRTSGLFRVARN